jgi:3-phosphoshikimate 1-carboxyvinyltransferase
MTDSLVIRPVSAPVRGVVRPPGSKSVTNRALAVAALAQGTSRLTGLLDSEDTRVMIESLRRLGIELQHDPSKEIAEVTGCAGEIPSGTAELDLKNSGTSLRFLTALCTLGKGTFRLDGNARMRQRPIGDLAAALNGLGANVTCETATGAPPVRVQAHGLAGGETTVAGQTSSQYLSALLMAAPGGRTPVTLHVAGDLVSRPYVEMTLGVMSAFGVQVATPTPGSYRIEPATYQALEYNIEPDASAASYFFAAAAITGGEVSVSGLSRNALQGDVRFASVLERMGCGVDYQTDRITVSGGELRGIDVDMNAISDTAQTLSVVALFAEGPTRIRNVAHIRHKETDRIRALTTELGRLGIRVEEHADGLSIHPGPARPATIETYDDHRMAMSFALVGLRTAGIRIADPDCTSKTYPRYFDDLQALCDSVR